MSYAMRTNKGPAWDSKSHYISAQGKDVPAHSNEWQLSNSKKGNSPVTRWVIFYLQDRNAAVYVDSITDIVIYTYVKMLQKTGFFTGTQSNDICKIL